MILSTTSKLPIKSQIISEPRTEVPGFLKLQDLTSGLIVLHVKESEPSRVIIDFFNVKNALEIGEAQSIDEGILCRLTTDEYLFLEGPSEEERTTLEHLQEVTEGSDIVLTDLTHGYGKFVISGKGVAYLLSSLCGLNFSETGFSDKRVAQTSLAKVHTILIRIDDQPDVPRFFVLIDRSLSGYVWKMMNDIILTFTKKDDVNTTIK